MQSVVQELSSGPVSKLASLLKLPGKAVSVRFRLRTVLEGWQLQASAVGPVPNLSLLSAQPATFLGSASPPSPFLHFPLPTGLGPAEWI